MPAIIRLHYLKAIEAGGTDEASAVMKKMKDTPVNDFLAKNGRIREEFDGRVRLTLSISPECCA